jgi:hypothetical protein
MAVERGAAAAPATPENAGSAPGRREPAAATPAAPAASPATSASAEASATRALPATSPAATPAAPPSPVDDDDDAESPAAPAPAGTGAGTASAAPTRAAAAPAAAVRTMADGGTYVGEVKLADGSLVKLSGIAWSDASPVAMINGKLVGPGQGVDQVTVDKIERDRVILRHRSGALFYLRLN